MRNLFTLKYIALLVLIGLNGYVWFSLSYAEEPVLKVSILDIGQGDSIFVEGPTGVQMLIDGGPDRSVLRQLPREMSLFDRSIDLVVETHPDKDHIAGLTDVFGRYRVSYFLSPGIPAPTATAKGLEEAVRTEPGVHSFTAMRGMRLHLGGGAYADVLYPDHDVSQGETNDGSIVMYLVYGATSFMLTGDSPSTVEDYLLSLDADNSIPTTVLKAGHHGSKSSTNSAWLAALSPEFVAISAGENNTYGHPSREVVERIKSSGAKMVSTIENGTLRFVSDGKELILE